MEFKKEIRDVISINPKQLLIYSKPKTGKTDLTNRLPNCAMVQLEEGADDLSGYIYDIKNISDLNDFIKWSKTDEFDFDYVVIDTINELERWCEVEATLNYMNSVQGKNFNRVSQKDIDKSPTKLAGKKGKAWPVGHSKFKSVLSLPQGYGYRWHREAFLGWMKKFKQFPCKVILLAHVIDKMIEKKEGVDVEGRDINLTGKLKSIVTSSVDAIGYLYRGKDGHTYISFESNEQVAEGARSKHLNGEQILIGEYDKEKKDYSKVYWDKIYIKE